MEREPYRIGCGAGFAGDRLDAAMPVVLTLAKRGGPSAIIFETLAERTLAAAQLARRTGGIGYDPLLEPRLEPVLGLCLRHGIRIIGNFGAADPEGAARTLALMAERQGLGRVRIALVEGDDLLAEGQAELLRALPADPPMEGQDLVAANVYLGARPIALALNAGADIVVTGRVADPSLVLGPLAHHFAWAWDDWERLAAGTLAGHLLECGAQVTGGYFADPGRKDVPGFHEVGFPIAEVTAEGGILLGKAEGTGGCVTLASVKEQILYEVHDPGAYLTPDVVLDITEVTAEAAGPDLVALEGARGHPRPETLKATLCADGGWQGEGEISYAGPGATARARLALEVLVRRLPEGCRWRGDLIGVASIFGDDGGRFLDGCREMESPDVRMRLAVQARERAPVERAMQEVVALYTCGPAGGAGIRTSLRPRLDTSSALVPREAVRPRFRFLGESP